MHKRLLDTRRHFLRLVLFGTPVLLTRCRESTQPLPLTAGKAARPLGLGKRRDGFFYVPVSVRKDAPLIVYLHGATGTGGRAIQRLLPYADATGTILLAPDSRGETWGIVEGEDAMDRDFIDAAMERVSNTHSVDPKRIILAGFSDGASAALSLGLVNGELFSGIAAFSPGFVHLSSPAKGTPRIFISHGTNDSILPVERCGRRIAQELRAAGYAVEYREFEGDHTVPAGIRDAGFRWLLERS